MNTNITTLIESAQSGNYTAAKALQDVPEGAFEDRVQAWKAKRLVARATHALVDGVRFEAIDVRSEPDQFTVRGDNVRKDYEFLTFEEAARKAAQLATH